MVWISGADDVMISSLVLHTELELDPACAVVDAPHMAGDAELMADGPIQRALGNLRGHEGPAWIQQDTISILSFKYIHLYPHTSIDLHTMALKRAEPSICTCGGSKTICIQVKVEIVVYKAK